MEFLMWLYNLDQNQNRIDGFLSKLVNIHILYQEIFCRVNNFCNFLIFVIINFPENLT